MNYKKSVTHVPERLLPMSPVYTLLLSRCLGEAEAARQEPRPPKGNKLLCVYGI